MGMPAPMMGGAGAASGVTNTAVTTTQEHMKSDKGQVSMFQISQLKHGTICSINN